MSGRVGLLQRRGKTEYDNFAMFAKYERFYIRHNMKMRGNYKIKRHLDRATHALPKVRTITCFICFK